MNIYVGNLPWSIDVQQLEDLFKEHGEVCPAGWAAGKAGMTPSDDGVKQYLTDHAESL